MTKKTFILLLLPLAVIVVMGLVASVTLLLGNIIAVAHSKEPATVKVEQAHSLRNAFSHPSAAVSEAKKMDFLLGRAMFKKLWVSAPASTKSSDGLGPLYNARSCLSCHPKNGRGRPTEKDGISQSLFLQLSIPATTKEHLKARAKQYVDHIPDPIYGSQLQNRAVQGHAKEGDVYISYQPVKLALEEGEVVTLRKPDYQVKNWGYGAPHKYLRISPRLAPQMIGLGLLEAIKAADIVKNADPDDKNQDGISGKASKVWSFAEQKLMLGRFGWKASTPSVLEQSSRALHSDIGISNPIFSQAFGDCTKAQSRCQNAPNGNSQKDNNFEIGKALNNRLAFYAAHLAVPKPRLKPKQKIAAGQRLFNAIGCASCHIPHFTLPASVGTGKALENQKISPYSDLLLHDMGERLSDNRPVHNASGSEWRTAPLWGIGLSKAVNGNAHFLHDGRARSIKEAILWHGGEALRARNLFVHLRKQNRDRLLAFVKSR